MPSTCASARRRPCAAPRSSRACACWPTALTAFFLPRPTTGGTLPRSPSVARRMATSWLRSERSSLRNASRIPLLDIVHLSSGRTARIMPRRLPARNIRQEPPTGRRAGQSASFRFDRRGTTAPITYSYRRSRRHSLRRLPASAHPSGGSWLRPVGGGPWRRPPRSTCCAATPQHQSAPTSPSVASIGVARAGRMARCPPRTNPRIPSRRFPQVRGSRQDPSWRIPRGATGRT